MNEEELKAHLKLIEDKANKQLKKNGYISRSDVEKMIDEEFKMHDIDKFIPLGEES